jgi:general secretion pathway protein B
MSYILDALKKAEAERRQETLSDLLIPPLPTPAASRFAPSATKRLTAWSGVAALAAALTGVIWLDPWHVWRLPPVTAPLPTPEASAAIEADVQSVPESPPPASPLQQEPALLPPPDPALLERSQQRKKKSPPAAVPSRTAPAARPGGQQASLDELPPSVRAELPPLRVSGHIYSETPDTRSVLVDRQLLGEGDQVVPGLQIERIMPDRMILAYKGYRIRIPFETAGQR